jgi:hypothetical protein
MNKREVFILSQQLIVLFGGKSQLRLQSDAGACDQIKSLRSTKEKRIEPLTCVNLDIREVISISRSTAYAFLRDFKIRFAVLVDQSCQ